MHPLLNLGSECYNLYKHVVSIEKASAGSASRAGPLARSAHIIATHMASRGPRLFR